MHGCSAVFYSESPLISKVYVFVTWGAQSGFIDKIFLLSLLDIFKNLFMSIILCISTKQGNRL